MSIPEGMGGALRKILHLTLPVVIIASLWILAAAQKPPQDRITTWTNFAGVEVTGNPYSRDVSPLTFPEYRDDHDDADEAEESPRPIEIPRFADVDAEEF